MKPLALCPSRRAMRGFSPAISGGLIEADQLGQAARLADAFSPAISGGLIEAVCVVWVTLMFAMFSPAISGGLIEATGAFGGRSAMRRVFARDKRGPH